MKEITIEELSVMPKESFMLIDIRDEGLAAYGMIPGAVNIPVDKLEGGHNQRFADIPKEKKLVFYCQIGRRSRELDDLACVEGRETFSLQDGYIGYIRSRTANETDAEERRLKAEDSIRRKYHEQLFTPFARACKAYQLISEGDRIAVCISGGKDSMLMAKLFQEIQKHRKVSFELVFLVMDPGYNKENRALIESNARLLGIPVTFFESRIFDAVDRIGKNPCYLCARMRRGYLYSRAKTLGCNKIALGHHYDDVIETVLMGMLHSGQFRTMMPKLRSSNFEGMELIRPMYLIREKDICAWRDCNDLVFLQCACHFTDTCTTCHEDGTTSSKRLETKKLIAELKKENPYIEANIFNSMENVDLGAVIGYKKDGVRHSFLEEY
uniref:PP-loop family protein n=1 Tax=uncultured bacterium Contig46 TaxID=1393580 RepID=W0FHG5_9BACT|nr:PP-loop family protein [uncultured bacterium Contig46]